jgi:hypothetical protein
MNRPGFCGDFRSYSNHLTTEPPRLLRQLTLRASQHRLAAITIGLYAGGMHMVEVRPPTIALSSRNHASCCAGSPEEEACLSRHSPSIQRSSGLPVG